MFFWYRIIIIIIGGKLWCFSDVELLLLLLFSGDF